MENPYLKMQVEVASPVERVVLLYDKAILLLKEALEALDEGDIPKKASAIARADRIIRVLNASLDMENGGEVAKVLRQFYDHLLDMLVVANGKNDRELLSTAIEMLETVKSAWEEIK